MTVHEGPCLYILSEHGEAGTQNLIATLDRRLLPQLLERQWGGTAKSWRRQAELGLKELLKQDDRQLQGGNGHNLQLGWGGIQLHVVRLQVARVEAVA